MSEKAWTEVVYHPQKSKAMDLDKKLHLETEWMRMNQSKTTGMVGVAKFSIIYFTTNIAPQVGISSPQRFGELGAPVISEISFKT